MRFPIFRQRVKNKKALAFLLIYSLSLIGVETKEKTLEEPEAENKALEMQLKNKKTQERN